MLLSLVPPARARQTALFRCAADRVFPAGEPQGLPAGRAAAQNGHMTEQNSTELGRFLRARRQGVHPEDVGLRPGSGRRRTPGLRREEIATLADVSIDYYTRLERGRETRPSPAVVDALARALLLDADGHQYLRALTDQAARRGSVPPVPPLRAVRPTVTRMLAALRPNPAYVVSRTYDMLAANPGGAALHPGLLGWPAKPNPGGAALHPGLLGWPAKQRNTIRYTFLHPDARQLWPDWEAKARGCVAQLRGVAGSDPDSPDLAALVGELLVKSPDFGRMWARYEVRRAGAGDRTFRHPLVGTLRLTHETLALNQAGGQSLIVYLAEPGTPDHDGIVLLDNADLTAAFADSGAQ
jgi:transcriptional regulator with XRE-family HTH domain